MPQKGSGIVATTDYTDYADWGLAGWLSANFRDFCVTFLYILPDTIRYGP